MSRQGSRQQVVVASGTERDGFCQQAVGACIAALSEGIASEKRPGVGVGRFALGQRREPFDAGGGVLPLEGNLCFQRISPIEVGRRRHNRVDVGLGLVIFFLLQPAQGAVEARTAVVAEFVECARIVFFCPLEVAHPDAADAAQLIELHHIGIDVDGLGEIGLGSAEVVERKLGVGPVIVGLVEERLHLNHAVKETDGREIVFGGNGTATHQQHVVGVDLGFGAERKCHEQRGHPSFHRLFSAGVEGKRIISEKTPQPLRPSGSGVAIPFSGAQASPYSRRRSGLWPAR